MIKSFIKYKLFILLISNCFLSIAQTVDLPPSDFRNNIIKLNVLPIAPLINGHNQKWIGLEYERFLHQNLTISLMVDAGLFEDYTFIKYHDYFDETVGFSYTRTKAKTWGYHLTPSLKYYFIATKKKKGQGFYLSGNFDLSQYIKKTEIYHSISNNYEYKNVSTIGMCIGATMGVQYVAFTRFTVDLNISIFAKLITINSSQDSEEIKPLHAIWIFNDNTGWATINLMIGYAFGGGKRK